MGIGAVEPDGVSEMREGTAGVVVTRRRPVVAGVTEIEADAVLFAEFGSDAAEDDTVATLVIEPECVVTPTMVTVADPPAGIVPREQTTEPDPTVQEPVVEAEDT